MWMLCITLKKKKYKTVYAELVFAKVTFERMVDSQFLFYVIFFYATNAIPNFYFILSFFLIKISQCSSIYYLKTKMMVSVLASSAIYCGFEPRSGQTKEQTIGICCFSAKHAALRSKSKDWLARNQNNVSQWSDISTRGLLFQ